MRWKWILVIGTILIIALMVAVYVFVATYDYNKLKPRIARMVKDATGRELNLSGEVNLDFGFSPALGKNIGVGEKHRGRVFILDMQ